MIAAATKPTARSGLPFRCGLKHGVVVVVAAGPCSHRRLARFCGSVHGCVCCGCCCCGCGGGVGIGGGAKVCQHIFAHPNLCDCGVCMFLCVLCEVVCVWCMSLCLCRPKQHFLCGVGVVMTRSLMGCRRLKSIDDDDGGDTAATTDFHCQFFAHTHRHKTSTRQLCGEATIMGGFPVSISHEQTPLTNTQFWNTRLHSTDLCRASQHGTNLREGGETFRKYLCEVAGRAHTIRNSQKLQQGNNN